MVESTTFHGKKPNWDKRDWRRLPWPSGKTTAFIVGVMVLILDDELRSYVRFDILKKYK